MQRRVLARRLVVLPPRDCQAAECFPVAGSVLLRAGKVHLYYQRALSTEFRLIQAFLMVRAGRPGLELAPVSQALPPELIPV